MDLHEIWVKIIHFITLERVDYPKRMPPRPSSYRVAVARYVTYFLCSGWYS